jgi:hypothetical protein
MSKYAEYAGRYQSRFLTQVRSLSADDLIKSGGRSCETPEASIFVSNT